MPADTRCATGLLGKRLKDGVILTGCCLHDSLAARSFARNDSLNALTAQRRASAAIIVVVTDIGL